MFFLCISQRVSICLCVSVPYVRLRDKSVIIYKDCVLGQCTVDRGKEKGYNTWEFISLSNKFNENILGLHTNRRININSNISEAKVTKVIIFIKTKLLTQTLCKSRSVFWKSCIFIPYPRRRLISKIFKYGFKK